MSKIDRDKSSSSWGIDHKSMPKLFKKFRPKVREYVQNRPFKFDRKSPYSRTLVMFIFLI